VQSNKNDIIPVTGRQITSAD